MELDNIKALWQKNNNSASFINPEEIKNMLRNEGEGALNKLIKWEKTCLRLMPLLTLSFWGILYMQSLVIYDFTVALIWLGIVVSLYAICSFISGFYKYKSLRKIDMVNMDIITVSNLITKYKKYVVYELIASFCWLIPVLIAIILIFLGTGESVWVYIGFTMYSITLIIIALYILKHFYFKKIKTIQQSVNEIRDFEKE
jgi:hypothetical protein